MSVRVRVASIIAALCCAGSASAQVYPPDLLAIAASPPSTATQGEIVPVEITVVNQGPGYARPFYVSVVLSRDEWICFFPSVGTRWCDESDDDWFVGRTYVSSGMVAGAQQTISVPMAIPVDFAPVSWNLMTLVDSGPNVSESNENNNKSLWGAILIGPGTNTLSVEIDVKPGSYPNSINLGSNGVVPVAILSSATFDATTVDPMTVTLASSPVSLRGNGQPAASIEDVNGDGLPDLVVQVWTEALQLTTTSTTVALQGYTHAGEQIAGYDEVNIVP